MKHKIKILILFLLFASPVGLIAQQNQSDDSTGIRILAAGNPEMSEEKLIYYDDVEVIFDEYRIYADYVEFNTKTKEILAKGRVTMSSNQTVITGERLSFNYKDRTGVMFDTYGQMSPSVRYNTDKLTQVDNETLRFNKLNFTTCSQCVPRWKITCSKGKIKKEKYIDMSHVFFKIKKIPIFYIPYIRYPVDKSGRATGFLFPSLGTSSQRGFFIMNSFFWAIKPNLDLTFQLDYYGKAGIGAAEELRYLFKHMEGNVKFYYFKYKSSVILGPDEEPADQNEFYTYNKSDYYLEMAHKQNIDFLNTKVVINIDKQSDANFLRLFSNNFYSVLRRTSKSSVAVTSTLGNASLVVSAAQRDDYFTFNKKSTSMRYFPSIDFQLNQQKIWKIPGYFSLFTSYSIINRIGKSYDEEDDLYVTDVTSKRLNVNPMYTLNMLKLPWMKAKLSLSSKHSFYPKSRIPGTQEIVDEPLHLNYNSVELDFTGPILSKIYEFRKFKIKHLISPRISFRYVTKVPDEDRARLIPVDYFDYPSYSYVGFSLTTRLLYKTRKTNSSPKEIFSYIVKQDYYFDPSLASRNRKIDGEYPEFSEFSHTLRLRPIKHFNVDAQMVYNFYLKDFTRIRFNLAYNNIKSLIHGNFSYSTYINPYAKPDYIFNRDTIGGNLVFDAKGFPIKLKAHVNYDITDKLFRGGIFRLSYDYQCIRFNAEIKLINFSGRVETQYNIGFNFGNLGMVKDLLGIDKKQ